VRNEYSKNRWYLLTPLFVICISIWVVPFLYQIYLSTLVYDLAKPGSDHEYVGLKNYIHSFSKDQYFIYSLVKTTKLSFICIISELFVGLFISFILLEIPHRISQIAISFLVIPFAIAPSIVGLIWYFQFNVDFGPIHYFLKKIGVANSGLLGYNSAFISITLVDLWQNTPFMILIFYSALKSIPKSILEVSKLDELSYVFKIKNIYASYVLPILITAVSLRFIGLIKTFDTIYVLTRGGPGTITETFPLYSYRLNYNELKLGLGAAQGIIVNYLVIIFFSIVFKWLKRK